MVAIQTRYGGGTQIFNDTTRHYDGAPIERPVLSSGGGFLKRSVCGGVDTMIKP